MKVGVVGQGMTAQAVTAYLAHPSTADDQGTIAEADVVIMSPGIAPETIDCQVEKWAEVEYAHRLMQRHHRPPVIIGVTGTNGKSTVVSLIAALVQAPAVGNIGDPLINYVMRPTPILVCELSSFQLECCHQFRPHIAVLLNIEPDHMDRHGTMASYQSAKQRLYQAQGPDDYLLLGDESLRAVCADARSQVEFVQLTDKGVWCPALVGAHNRINQSIAVRVAQLMGVTDTVIQQRLATFRGLPHRLERVRSVRGRVFYNDSKATNPAAVQVAIAAFSEPMVLLLCGADKGIDFGSFMATLPSHIRQVIVFGAIATHVAGLRAAVPVQMVSTMSEAIELSMTVSESGDVIVLSPGSSSFDQFTSFEDRGDQFCRLVERL